jgi:multidrug efflux system membrane fusion protein
MSRNLNQRKAEKKFRKLSSPFPPFFIPKKLLGILQTMNFLMKNPYLLALLISIALAIWLISGQITPVESSEEASEEIAKTSPIVTPNLMKVRVLEKIAQPLTREIILTGRTAPIRTVELRAELETRVIQIGAPRGARVKTGDLIVRLAIDDRALRLKEAQALVKQRELEYQAKRKLLRKGYQSQIQIAEAFTLLENAKTLVEQAEIALEHTTIRAPFDGVLVKRTVEKGDYVSFGTLIAEIIDEAPFLIKGEVSELQRHHLKLGQRATARLVTGQTVTGKISLIAAQAEATTRTFNLEIEVPNPKGKLAAGITCEIQIPLETVPAHQVSSALLSLNDAGILGVKTVNAENRVEFYPAHFARATAAGIWLTGLPHKLRFITVGQGFVRSDELVEPVNVTKE